MGPSSFFPRIKFHEYKQNIRTILIKTIIVSEHKTINPNITEEF